MAKMTRTIFAVISLALFTAWPAIATPLYTAIIIESGSPYFVPKSATVSSGTPIRWDNPTATEHTITHSGCLENGDTCAFDSGVVLPNSSFTLPGLAPGSYPLSLPSPSHYARSLDRPRHPSAPLSDIIDPFP